MDNARAYIAGGGLAGIATAFYLIRKGGFPGERVTVFEAMEFAGGSLDAFFEPQKSGYFMRGFRMLEDHVYSAFFDLISSVPTLEDPGKSLMDDFVEFNDSMKTHARVRLLEKGKPVAARPFRLPLIDRVRLMKLLALPEGMIAGARIDGFFSPGFFRSNFWLEFCTTFSFQPWHSLEEFRRYILRFIQDSHLLDIQTCVRNTRFNQFDSVIRPVKKWLQAHGVEFRRCSTVTDASFAREGGKMRITEIRLLSQGREERVEIGRGSLVFLTLGSMTGNVATGSMDEPPPRFSENGSSCWHLWENIGKWSPEFGRHAAFDSDVGKTGWVSFTTTLSSPLFTDLLRGITRVRTGTEGILTIKDSNWLISFAFPAQPHFIGQPDNLQVFWGYGLNPEKPGNFVRKLMSECSGREILIELLSHLRFEKDLDALLDSAICIPCMMPYITSQFMPRNPGDRPKVVPDCSGNFAFIGQYCEIPEDIVFTVEYSVRSAQMAVYSLLGCGESPTPIFKGWKRFRNLFNAVRTIMR